MNIRLVIIVVIVLLGVMGLVVLKGKTSGTKEAITFFYSKTCSHCKEVEDFIAKNKIREKVTFSEKELTSDPRATQELISAAKVCNYDGSVIPVPFLFDGKKCHIGSTDVINFFKEKVKNNSQK